MVTEIRDFKGSPGALDHITESASYLIHQNENVNVQGVATMMRVDSRGWCSCIDTCAAIWGVRGD